MNILNITHENVDALQGGLGTFTLMFAQAMKQEGHKIVSVLTEHSPSPPSEFFALKISPDPGFSQLKQLEKIISVNKIDVILVNDRQNFRPILKLETDIPIVFALHLSYPDMIHPYRWDDNMWKEYTMERAALDIADRIVVFSEFSKNRLTSGGIYNIKESRIRKVKMGINPEEWRFVGNRRELKTISYFGRIENLQKNFQSFVDGVGLLDLKGIQVNAYGHSFKDSPTIPRRVQYHGMQRGGELAKAYAASDIVVMPSLYEPFGLVGLEAMASGSLLVYTPGLGMDEYADERNAIPLQGTTADDIANSLVPVIENWGSNKGYHSHRRNALATARSWSWKEVSKDLVEALTY